MTKTNNELCHVVIIQQIIPTYREDFFMALSRVIKIEIYASSKGLEKTLTTLTRNTAYKTLICSSLNISNKLIFQFLPFIKLLKESVIIFEFNLRIISNIFLLVIRILTGKKNILWSHGIRSDMTVFSKNIRLFFLKRADSVIVYGNDAKKILSSLGVQEKNIFVAKNSLNASQICKLQDSSVDRHRITFIGRLINEKNVSLLCKAFLSVISTISPNIILTIIGDGEELQVLKKQYPSNRIEFIGELKEEKSISKYMNQSLFLVSPDFLGLMIVHGFCYAIPILVNSNPSNSHSPEIELFEEGVNGFYFDGSQNNLEVMLLKCLQNPQLLRTLGLNGFNSVSNNYGVEEMVESFLNAISHSNNMTMTN